MALLVAGSSAAACDDSGEPVNSTSCPFPTPPAPGQAAIGVPGVGGQSIPAPPGGSGMIKVVETGFSQFDDGSKVTIGAVVENGTGQVAYRTQVIFRAATGGGEPGIDKDETNRHLFEIPILRPGQRAVIGNFANVDDAALAATGKYPSIARAGLDLLRTQWIPAQDTNSYPTITTTVTAPASVAAANADGIPVAASSDACHDLRDRGASMVYRTSAGKIVGGTFDVYDKLGLCRTPAGQRSILPFPAVPAGADLKRTEATAMCDVTGPGSPSAAGPDGPVN
ncbi:hypothetical protein BJY16_004888 [Actinoplanes octamycinicus]|uniref:Uncharacterized protein n=1 Tax=Actinoplanes octamycinicus TaxID=135948 RepID=A0A7W7GZZ5_9ACTN|nr:hypothetical protein [Actinoplanes octamycinicus]MBB4741429.1 hypothetical protein [Actinoplanes octamycinicus]